MSLSDSSSFLKMNVDYHSMVFPPRYDTLLPKYDTLIPVRYIRMTYVFCSPPLWDWCVYIGAYKLTEEMIRCVCVAHYSDVIMGYMASQITSLTIVKWTVYSGGDQRKHQSSASLAFVRGIHRWPVSSPHKWPATRRMFPFDDVIMSWWYVAEGIYLETRLLTGQMTQICVSKLDHHWSRW